MKESDLVNLMKKLAFCCSFNNSINNWDGKIGANYN